jgi:hypothetical protein
MHLHVDNKAEEHFDGSWLMLNDAGTRVILVSPKGDDKLRYMLQFHSR